MPMYSGYEGADVFICVQAERTGGGKFENQFNVELDTILMTASELPED